jgi:hypothetical protein
MQEYAIYDIYKPTLLKEKMNVLGDVLGNVSAP